MASIPTAQAVSAALKKAGFERSKSFTTAVKGWHEHTEGYQSRSWGEGEVRVFHETGFGRGEAAARRRDAKLAEYAGALEAKGWTVKRHDSGTPCLRVTAPEEGR